MTSLLIYVSGPISGMSDANQPAFNRAAKALSDLGHSVCNPFENGLSPDATWEEHMRADIRMLLKCDGVAMLPGWRGSRGANIERQLALDLGMPVMSLGGWLGAARDAAGAGA